MASNTLPEGADKDLVPSPRRSGIRIKHWLLIVVLSALLVDIGMRAGLFRRLSGPSSAELEAQRQAEQALAEAQQAFLNQNTFPFYQDLVKSQQQRLDLEKLLEPLKDASTPRDPAQGNIIQL